MPEPRSVNNDVRAMILHSIITVSLFWLVCYLSQLEEVRTKNIINISLQKRAEERRRPGTKRVVETILTASKNF